MRMTDLDFRNYLSKQETKISLTHRIPVGEKDESAPMIKDLDWCPKPQSLKGKDALAVVASLSSFGTNIYYYPKVAKRWTSLVIKHRPSRIGQCLQWHTSGKYLATTSDPSDARRANLTILKYNMNDTSFYPSGVSVFSASISSLAWIQRGKYIVAAQYPRSFISFIEFNDETGVSKKLGKVDTGLPKNCPIALQAHPSGEYFFACSEQANVIQVWGAQKSQDGNKLTWSILRSINCGIGVYSMTFSNKHSGLIAIKKNYWKFFAFDEDRLELLILEFESCNEHSILKGKKLKGHSGLISMAAAREKLLASGGWGDTFIIHALDSKTRDTSMVWKPSGSRNGNFSYGKINCIKFNPKNDPMMMVSTGGDSGFIHIWAVHKTTSHRLHIVDPERRLEQLFYSDRQPELVDVPSTSIDWDAHRDGDVDQDGNRYLYIVGDEVEYDKVVEYEEEYNEEAYNEAMGNAEYEEEVDEAVEEEEVGMGRAEEGMEDVEVAMERIELTQRELPEKDGDSEVGMGRAVQLQQDVQGVEGLNETFQTITDAAEKIKRLIEADVAAPAEEVLSLCKNLLQAKDAINSILRKSV